MSKVKELQVNGADEDIWLYNSTGDINTPNRLEISSGGATYYAGLAPASSTYISVVTSSLRITVGGVEYQVLKRGKRITGTATQDKAGYTDIAVTTGWSYLLVYDYVVIAGGGAGIGGGGGGGAGYNSLFGDGGAGGGGAPGGAGTAGQKVASESGNVLGAGNYYTIRLFAGAGGQRYGTVALGGAAGTFWSRPGSPGGTAIIAGLLAEAEDSKIQLISSSGTVDHITAAHGSNPAYDTFYSGGNPTTYDDSGGAGGGSRGYTSGYNASALTGGLARSGQPRNTVTGYTSFGYGGAGGTGGKGGNASPNNNTAGQAGDPGTLAEAGGYGYVTIKYLVWY